MRSNEVVLGAMRWDEEQWGGAMVLDEVQLGGLRCDEEQCGLKYKVAWGPNS